MIEYSLRQAKRFAVLLPGISIALLSVHTIFPYFDARLPVALAIFVTYVLGAYLLVPALIRLYRIFRPPRHLPVYCVTPDGFASDPLNIGIIGTRHQLILSMEAAGWHVADPYRLRHIAHHAVSTVLDLEYAEAPVSRLYLFGRKQDIAFEIPLPDGRGNRHHVRFWATSYQPNKRLSFRSIDWQHRREHIKRNDVLWVGAASLDIGISLIRHNLQLTHMIDPNTDQERELIVSGLQSVGIVQKQQTITLGNPYRLINRVLRGSLHADGKMTILSLKKSTGS